MKPIPTKLTPANITAVMDILTATPIELECLSAPLSAEQLRQPLGEGERTFTEAMVHLINGEARTSQSIYMALLSEEPLFPDVHPDRDMGKLLHYERFDFPELLAYFKMRRVVLLSVLNGLKEAQWSRVIREEGKQRKESVYLLARMTALHELDHVTDLQRKLGMS
jgi:hypothetical protein